MKFFVKNLLLIQIKLHYQANNHISITAKSSDAQYSSVYACILTEITPNLEPCINKAFFSKNPTSDNFEKFDNLFQFDKNEL